MSNCGDEDLSNPSELKKVIDEYGDELFKGYSSLKVNIKECLTHLFVEVELPGIPKKNISMELEPTSIEIRASTDKIKGDYSGMTVNYIRRERLSGKFKRIIELPCKININEASATYHEGVLYIELIKPDDSINKGRRQLKLY